MRNNYSIYILQILFTTPNVPLYTTIIWPTFSHQLPTFYICCFHAQRFSRDLVSQTFLKRFFLSYVFSGWFLLSSLTIGHTCHSTYCSSLKLVNLNIIKSMQNHTYYSLKVFSCSPINLEHNAPFYFLYCPIIYLIFSSSMTWNKTTYIITLSFFMLFA